jgi:hypothetical protein
MKPASRNSPSIFLHSRRAIRTKVNALAVAKLAIVGRALAG